MKFFIDTANVEEDVYKRQLQDFWRRWERRLNIFPTGSRNPCFNILRQGRLR